MTFELERPPILQEEIKTLVGRTAYEWRPLDFGKGKRIRPPAKELRTSTLLQRHIADGS